LQERPPRRFSLSQADKFGLGAFSSRNRQQRGYEIEAIFFDLGLRLIASYQHEMASALFLCVLAVQSGYSVGARSGGAASLITILKGEAYYNRRVI
jgi:hypothetical protein